MFYLNVFVMFSQFPLRTQVFDRRNRFSAEVGVFDHKWIRGRIGHGVWHSVWQPLRNDRNLILDGIVCGGISVEF
jgi:hypothetical protein